MIKTTNKSTTMMNRNKVYNQSEAIMKYLKRKSRSKLTTEQVCNGIKESYNLTLTIPQVSKCLNRLCDSNVVYKLPTKGTNTIGRTVSLWSLAPHKS